MCAFFMYKHVGDESVCLYVETSCYDSGQTIHNQVNVATGSGIAKSGGIRWSCLHVHI